MTDPAQIKKKLEEVRLRKTAERLGAHFCKRCGKEYDPEEVDPGPEGNHLRLYRLKFCSEECWDVYWRTRTRLHMGLDP